MIGFCILQNVMQEVKENHAIIVFNLSYAVILPPQSEHKKDSPIRSCNYVFCREIWYWKINLIENHFPSLHHSYPGAWWRWPVKLQPV